MTPILSWAKGFPSGPIRIFVGFTPGSPSDVLARGLADKLSKASGQTCIVDNKPGAGGLLAVKSLLQAPADGHSLLVVSASHAAAPAVTRNLGFDPARDLAAITRIANVPSLLVVSPKLGVSTLQMLLDRLKKEPGALNFSSPGTGSANHFAAEHLLALVKAKATHIPYRGVPEAASAIVAGDCHFSFIPAPNALALVESGRLQVLATSTGTRAQAFPSIPTVAEAGVSQYEFDPWFGVLTQAAVPAQALDRLIAMSIEGLNSPDLRTRFNVIGAEISTLPGNQFDIYIQQEIAKFRHIASEAGIVPT
ncbi:tripartite tricarboxylate transporter substrate-binding protein [Acidovorax sp. SDU_ACID1]|uniref:tripartite tricarboxylate transporter substrate-binding protein n=1 Tax=Acidovorax sp. SDU_ACID1 TaxID=3136632 RepID=UPI00387399FE